MEDKKTLRKVNKFGMLKSQYIQYSLWYFVIISVIIILESSMIGYNIYRGFSDNWRGIAYFVSYVVLDVASLYVLIVMIYNKVTNKGIGLLVKLLSVYGVILVLWATAISSLDIYRGKTIIVYFTIIAIIAAVLPIHPLTYFFTVIPTTCILYGVLCFHGDAAFKESGYLLNVGVFILFSIILEIITYRMNYNDYISREKLKKLTEVDQLTGVYNRYALRKDVNMMACANVYSFGIIDIDDFKRLNDEFGHEVGDECLVDVASKLREKFGDNVYRYGGDEFCLIVQLPEMEIKQMFNEINDALSLKYLDKSLNISGGFYTPTTIDESYQEIFRKADKALYNAKREGKNRVLFFRNEQ